MVVADLTSVGYRAYLLTERVDQYSGGTIVVTRVRAYTRRTLRMRISNNGALGTSRNEWARTICSYFDGITVIVIHVVDGLFCSNIGSLYLLIFLSSPATSNGFDGHPPIRSPVCCYCCHRSLTTARLCHNRVARRFLLLQLNSVSFPPFSP